jgi:uncharacterized membrane protein YdbT with pleckstrin-like domain
MGYIESNLANDEKILARGKVHWMIFLRGVIVICFGLILLGVSDRLGFAIIVIGAIILFFAWLNFVSTELAVTSKRVIAKLGIIKRTTIELNLTKVESFHVEQGILGRLLNFGTIIIRGTGGTPTPIPSISDPLEFRRVAIQTVDAGSGPARAVG